GGSLGESRVSAQLKRDPPDPGAPRPRAPRSVGGQYQLAPTSPCLGSKIKLEQSGSAIDVTSSKRRRGILIYRAGALAGTIACEDGERRALSGTAAGRAIDLMIMPPAAAAAATVGVTTRTHPGAGPTAGPPTRAASAAVVELPEHISAIKQRTAESTVVAFFVAVVIVMLFARLCGSLVPKIGQPRVMGEVLAGILLGPTAFGALAPGLESTVFASDIVPYIGVAANLGLIFYM